MRYDNEGKIPTVSQSAIAVVDKGAGKIRAAKARLMHQYMWFLGGVAISGCIVNRYKVLMDGGSKLNLLSRCLKRWVLWLLQSFLIKLQITSG